MPDDGVDSERVKVIDFLLSRDAAGGRDAAVGGIPHGENRLEVRAAHQAFVVDVRVEKLAAERLEGLDGLTAVIGSGVFQP